MKKFKLVISVLLVKKLFLNGIAVFTSDDVNVLITFTYESLLNTDGADRCICIKYQLPLIMSMF